VVHGKDECALKDSGKEDDGEAECEGESFSHSEILLMEEFQRRAYDFGNQWVVSSR
jgi:hypothetical protein